MDIQKIREDFPILSRTVYGKPLVYFDNGATTQKPRLVVDALVDEYYSVNANVHRGVHYLSPSKLRNCMKLPARQCAGLSMPVARVKSYLPVEQQKASTCLSPALVMNLWKRAMKSSSR